jgi:hypothetical protein
MPCLVYEVQNLAHTTCRVVCISTLRFGYMNLGWKDQPSPLLYLHSKDPMPAIHQKLDQIRGELAVKNVLVLVYLIVCLNRQHCKCTYISNKDNVICHMEASIPSATDNL